MLVPFERNLIYHSNFNGIYIPTLINDICRFEKIQSGIVLCVSDERTGYIVIKENKLGYITSLTNDFSSNLQIKSGFSSYFNNCCCDVYFNVVEDCKTLDNIILFLSAPLKIFAPSNLFDLKRLLGNIEAEKESGIIGFKHGTIINLAIYEKGSFNFFLYYYPETKSYVNDKNISTFESYIENVSKLYPSYIYKKFDGKKSKEYLQIEKCDAEFLAKDLILIMTNCYIDLFNIVLTSLKENLGNDKITEVFNLIFSSLRTKYSPLYSSINYSPENRSVNWTHLFLERKFISQEYRFAEYHLYLDELLKFLMKVSISFLGADSSEKMVVLMKKYLSNIEKENDYLRDMVFRVDKMVEKVKY